MDDMRRLERFRWIAGWALFFLYTIVITGVTVRLTGSGLGCPDWPACNGINPTPELEYHGMIEFANRVWSLPTMFFTGWLAWASRGLPADRRDLRIGAWTTLGFVLANVVMGGLTIRLELDPTIVSSHFLISMATLAAVTFTFFAAGHRRLRWRAFADHRLTWLAAGALLLVGASVIVAGVLTTAAGPHSGGNEDQVIERLQLGDAGLAVTVHARGAYLFAALVIGMTLVRRRTRAGARDIALLSALVVMQIVLGEVQYRTGLPWGVVLLHVANAAAIWAITCHVAFAALARQATGDEHDTGPVAQRRGDRFAVNRKAGPHRSADNDTTTEELPA